jgi:hypothetical protein
MSFFTAALLIAFDEIAYTLGTSEKMRHFTHPDSGRFWVVDPSPGETASIAGQATRARYRATHFIPSDARDEFD